MHYILYLLMWALAGFFNSIMDVMVSRFHRSVFSKIKNKFWYEFFEDNSWDNKYVGEDSTKGRIMWSFLGIKFKAPVQLLDGWHFSKMLSIFCYGFSVLFYFISDWHPHLIKSDVLYISEDIANILIDILIAGSIRNAAFMLFYTRIWIIK